MLKAFPIKRTIPLQNSCKANKNSVKEFKKKQHINNKNILLIISNLVFLLFCYTILEAGKRKLSMSSAAF